MSVIQPVSPVATAEAGGLWQSFNGGLSDALNVWGKVEQIKGERSASGQDLQAAVHNPELANGAAVQVDRPLTQQKQSGGGMEIPKPLLYASLGLLGLAFVLRMKGFN